MIDSTQKARPAAMRLTRGGFGNQNAERQKHTKEKTRRISVSILTS